MPRRAIARYFGLSEAAVRRHTKNHAEEQLQVALAEISESTRSYIEALPGRLEPVVQRLETSAELAPRRRAVERCATAVAELADVIASLAAFARLVPPAPTTARGF